MAVALGVMWLRGSPSSPSGAVAAPVIRAVMPAPSTSALAPSTAAIDPVPTTTAAPGSAAVAPVPPEVSPTDLPLAPAGPAHLVLTPRTSAPRRSGSAGCDPPYTIDANGYKKYKRECASL